MRIFTTSRFAKSFKKCPPEVQKIAIDVIEIFRINPRDPRIKTHKLHGELKGNLAFSVTGKFRIMFYFEDPNTVVFVKIGDHDIYT